MKCERVGVWVMRGVVCAWLGARLGLAAEQPEFSGRIEIAIDDALGQYFGPKAAFTPRPINLYATCEKGQWTDIWAYGPNYNRGLHLGRAGSGTVTDDRMRLTFTLDVAADAWIHGGRAVFDLTLQRQGDRLEGTHACTYTGTFGEWRGAGRVNGVLLPPEPVTAGFVPVEPGEHPRLLFRKQERPALRKKMETPFGRVLVDELRKRGDDPVAMGMLYQLTGDTSYARKALPAIEAVMDNRNGGAFALGRFWGYRTIVVAHGYDLCYEAWTPEERMHVENYLDWILYKCRWRQHRVGTVNWQPGSNYTVVIFPGHAAAALAMWKEKGPAPFAPLEPRTAAVTLEPSADLSPARAVPVTALRLDGGKVNAPSGWLQLGPFEHRVYQHPHPWYDYDDPGAPLAVCRLDTARPSPGQKVAFGKQSSEWRPLDAASFSADPSGKTQFNTTALTGDRENRHLFFYTTLQVETAGYYKLLLSYYAPLCFLGGTRFTDGEIVHLPKGVYPLLVRATTADGEYRVFFQMAGSSQEEADAFYAAPQRQTDHARWKAEWQERQARWEAGKGADVDWADNFDAYRHLSLLCTQYGMGDGGFQGEGEGYTLECHHVVHDYALAHLSVLGKSMSGHPDISRFVPRYVMTTVFPGGEAKPVSQGYGRGGGAILEPHYVARGIGLCPEEWKPGVLWFWLKQMGLSAEELRTEAGAKQAFPRSVGGDVMALAQAFVHYPPELQPKNPGEVMPHVWHARTRGFCAFRNGWLGGDSIVAQIYAKEGPSCGWSQAEAGAFQIYGLGQEWAWKDNDAYGKTGSYWAGNIVMLPEDPFHAWGHGKVVHFAGDEKTGSGVVTIDMNDVYTCFGKVGDQEGFADTTIRGLRSFGADYSGKAGVPALFAVCDKITGGKKKIWVFQLPRNGAEVSVAGNTFTLAKDGVSMRATVVSPANARIEQAKGGGAQKASNVPDAVRPALHVTGPSGAEGDFFVIMTLQKGAAPAVTVNGAGLGAKVTVGQQSVAFDGQNVVLGR